MATAQNNQHLYCLQRIFPKLNSSDKSTINTYDVFQASRLTIFPKLQSIYGDNNLSPFP